MQWHFLNVNVSSAAVNKQRFLKKCDQLINDQVLISININKYIYSVVHTSHTEIISVYLPSYKSGEM